MTSVSFVEIHDRFQNSSFCNNMICCALGNVYHSWSGISEKWSLEETKNCHASPDGVLAILKHH